jgi:hypothetical protein
MTVDASLFTISGVIFLLSTPCSFLPVLSLLLSPSWASIQHADVAAEGEGLDVFLGGSRPSASTPPERTRCKIAVACAPWVAVAFSSGNAFRLVTAMDKARYGSARGCGVVCSVSCSCMLPFQPRLNSSAKTHCTTAFAPIQRSNSIGRVIHPDT